MGLYFRHGVMGSGKSTQLLQIVHDYETINGLGVLVLKPSVDSKGEDYVVTRMGDGQFKRKCDFLITPDMDIYQVVEAYEEFKSPVDLIVIDESQFLSKQNVLDLVDITTLLDIPVICFGLRSNFLGEPFEGSSWLFALAEDIEEISTRALDRLGKKKRATMNLRMLNGIPTFTGETVGIDGKDNIRYIPVSLKSFMEQKTKRSED